MRVVHESIYRPCHLAQGPIWQVIVRVVHESDMPQHEEAHGFNHSEDVTVVKAANRSGEDGELLCSSYVDAFAPQASSPLDRIWEEWDHRQHIGYARFFLPRWSWRRPLGR